MTRRITPLVAVATTLVLLSAGCSDDITCPEVGPAKTLPYISALVVQRSDDGDASTRAEVDCTGDPVPLHLAAVINERTLLAVERPDGLGFVATLDVDAVLWQPGILCELQVSADYGAAAHAAVIVPDATAVTEPAEISLGDSLKLVWRSAAAADYYEVSAVLITNAGATGNRDTLALSETTRETFAVFPSEVFSSPGVVSGVVETVAGSFPELGAAGNISGEGWGFFTLQYRDSGSAFEVIVSDVP